MLKSPQNKSLPLHADNKILNKVCAFVDIRLKGSVHYDKSNRYGNGSNQKFNVFESSMCQMR